MKVLFPPSNINRRSLWFLSHPTPGASASMTPSVRIGWWNRNFRCLLHARGMESIQLRRRPRWWRWMGWWVLTGFWRLFECTVPNQLFDEPWPMGKCVNHRLKRNRPDIWIYLIDADLQHQKGTHSTTVSTPNPTAEAFELMNCNFSASIEAGFLHFFKHPSLDISTSLVKQANSEGRP